MTMLQTKFKDNYINNESDASVFMSILLFPLTCAFSNIPKINNFRTSIYVSTFFYHCHVQYYQRYEDYNLCIFILTRVDRQKQNFCPSVSFRKYNVWQHHYYTLKVKMIISTRFAWPQQEIRLLMKIINLTYQEIRQWYGVLVLSKGLFYRRVCVLF